MSRHRVAHNVRANYRAVQLRVRIGFVKLRVDSRSQIRTRFQQRDCVQAPTAKRSVQQTGRTRPMPTLTLWQVVRPGQ